MPICQRTMCPVRAVSRAISWLLRDDFLTTASAPLSSPRTCEPGPGGLTLTQTSGNLSIDADGLVVPTTGSPAWGNMGARHTAGHARAAGRINYWRVKKTGGTFGYAAFLTSVTNLSLASGVAGIYFNNTTLSWSAGGGTVSIGSTPSGWYHAVIVERATGYFGLEKREGESVFRLLTVLAAGTTATIYGCVNNYDLAYSVRRVGIPDLTWTPTPLASDSFDRSDSSSLGSTNGAGVEETGGSGLAWADLTGDPQIASNAFCASGSADTAATVDLGKSDVVLCATLTARASGPGIVFRAVDANNYWRAAIDGSNIKIWERTGGSWTERASAAASTSNGTDYFAVLALEGTSIRFTVGNVMVTYTSSVRQTATVHGVYSGTTDGTVKSFGAFDRFQSTFPEQVAA